MEHKVCRRRGQGAAILQKAIVHVACPQTAEKENIILGGKKGTIGVLLLPLASRAGTGMHHMKPFVACYLRPLVSKCGLSGSRSPLVLA